MTKFEKDQNWEKFRYTSDQSSQLLLYNFGLFQQVFENLKLNKLVKEERRLDLEDKI